MSDLGEEGTPVRLEINGEKCRGEGARMRLIRAPDASKIERPGRVAAARHHGRR